MPVTVNRDKWILYKHTCDYELIKAVALDVKNQCATNINSKERYKMQERLTALNLYKMRNKKERPLDSINHRINTLEFYMFGYEESFSKTKKFIFSPLGNLFIKYIDDPEKLKYIFSTMLFGMQFEHYANNTPNCFQLYPFRLIFKLMTDQRLDNRLYSMEYAYIVAFVKTVDDILYEKIVSDILKFRSKTDKEKIKLLKKDEHTYVNCIYEWQYYTLKLLKTIGIIQENEGDKLCKLYHPQKINSKSSPTGRWVRNGYASIDTELQPFIKKMLDSFPVSQKPLRFDEKNRMMMDIVKEIYSFYPELLLETIGERTDDVYVKLLKLPSLIEKYAQNPDNETAYLFEDILEEGFNMFVNVEAKKIGGAGHTDIECLYLTKRKKFAVEAKSTSNKLTLINSGRLREHREQIGGDYTIVITPRYVPAAKRDIKNEPIVIILANTFAEYLYNHIYHDIREIDYADFDDVIISNLGMDVSQLISNMTMEKFAAQA